MKNSTHLFFVLLFLLFTATVKGQKDDDIKKAKTTATTATNNLKKYQKFSNNDSVRWLFGGDASLTFNATSLTNWAAGGEDQIGVSPAVNLYANYKKDKRTFENYGTFSYGIVKAGERKAVKNSDLINLVSKVGHQMSPKWYYSASLVTRTQFSPGYKYTKTDTIRISDFAAPLNLYLSVGIDYRPNDNFSTAFSPLMGKATFARSNDLNVLSNVGLTEKKKNEAGEEITITKKRRYEFGGGILMTTKGNLIKNKISYNSQLDLFSNYAVKPQNVDIYWLLQLKILIYKNISADLRFELKYDDDQASVDSGGPRLQIRNQSGLSLFYQFK